MQKKALSSSLKIKPIIASLALLSLFVLSLYFGQSDFYKIVNLPLHQTLNETLKETAVTFATTRAVNAVISLVQESTFGFSLGINVSIAAGQILDPLNDLIERFSQLTLACLVALTLQKVLLDLGITLSFNLFIPLTCLAGITFAWVPEKLKPNLAWIYQRLTMISLFTLLALPVCILATETVDTLLLANQINGANARINQISSELNQNAPDSPALDAYSQTTETSFFEKFKQSSEQAKQQIEQPAKILMLLDQIKTLDASTFVEDVILLCSMYLLRAFLLPIIAIWLTYRTGKSMLVILIPRKQL